MEYQIKWKKGDAIKLGKAISEFNKKINRLQSEENALYLPEKLSFAEEKENITTRKELERRIASLKRFQKSGAETLYRTRAGEEITRWERSELEKQKRIAERRIQKELAEINTPLKRSKIF